MSDTGAGKFAVLTDTRRSPHAALQPVPMDSVKMKDGSATSLVDPQQFAGYGAKGDSGTVLLKANGLHLELQIDKEHPIGAMSASGLKDIIAESALTTSRRDEPKIAKASIGSSKV